MSRTHGSDPLRGIPLEALRGFEAAARLLNFTHAAKELHLTQSAVSREIRSLEERLGTKLFERMKGELRLTHAGLGLQRDVTESLTMMRRGIERITGTTNRRSFVVVTSRSMMSDWLWSRVSEYTNRHPEIDLRIAPAPRSGAPGDGRGIDDIDATDMDIGIRLLPRANADGRWERLITEYAFPCCTSMLADDPKRPIRTIDDLAHHTLLDLDDGMPALDANWAVWCERAGVAPIKPVAWKRVPDWSLVFALAAQGQGVCLGRTSGVNDRIRQGLLVAPLPDVTLSTRAWYLVTSTRCRNDPHASAFVEWLRSEARREEDFAQVLLRGKRVRGD
jgi:LysR family transcriptional regulator, glycine cleavage system transcriptional activator